MTMTLEELREACSALPIGNRYAQFDDSIDSAIRERADLWSKWQTERCFRAKAEAELAALKARIAGAHELDTGYGTTPSMWELLSEELDGVKLPESLNAAIYALRDDHAAVVEK